MNIYLAGGAVRDLLMGTPITDRDYLVTNSTKDAFMKRFPSAQEVGRAFPIFLLDKQEFSFPRAETLSEELRSRDLTVNALLLDENGELVCHPKALEDIHQKALRPASPHSLHEDPVRVYRAARFWARFPEFFPHEELLQSMRTVAKSGKLHSIAPDRVGMETLKALQAPRPGNYLRLLAQGDCLEPWFTEFEKGRDIPAGPLPYHDTDVIEHTCQTMDNLAGHPMAALMGMCHDLGKTQTKRTLLPRHHGHDKRGIQLARNLIKRIRLSNHHIKAGTIAAKWHMIAGRYDELRPGTRVDLLMELHLSQTFDDFFALVHADQNKDFSHVARQELATVLSVSLPSPSRNLGEKSGQILRGMRAAALANHTQSFKTRR